MPELNYANNLFSGAIPPRPMQSYLVLSPWRHGRCYCPVHMENLRLRLITFPVHPGMYFIMQSRPYYLQHTFQYCIQDPSKTIADNEEDEELVSCLSKHDSEKFMACFLSWLVQ